MYEHTSTFGRRGAVIHAMSGIDIALWDILGKVTGRPLYQLLGGARRDRVRVYASDLTPEDKTRVVPRAKELFDQGYTGVKFGWGTLGQNVREDARWVNELRRGVGPKVDLMVDMGAAISFGDALWLGNALAEDDVYFLEEPLSPDNLDGFAELVAASPTAIATGEKETTRFGFRDLMERGKLRIIQPDIARVGGITEIRRIAALAEIRNVCVIPHCWATDILVNHRSLRHLPSYRKRASGEPSPRRPRAGGLRQSSGSGRAGREVDRGAGQGSFRYLLRRIRQHQGLSRSEPRQRNSRLLPPGRCRRASRRKTC